jgi:hypothetical protein
MKSLPYAVLDAECETLMNNVTDVYGNKGISISNPMFGTTLFFIFIRYKEQFVICPLLKWKERFIKSRRDC